MAKKQCNLPASVKAAKWRNLPAWGGWQSGIPAWGKRVERRNLAAWVAVQASVERYAELEARLMLAEQGMDDSTVSRGAAC